MGTSSTTTARGRSDVPATGQTAFAAALLILTGMFQMFAGLAALANDEILVRVPGYLYEISLTAWGWVLLLIGAAAALTGVVISRGTASARRVGIGCAGLSALANFAFVPYYPVWSILVVALDVTIIWALLAHGRERA
jgi:hypothetical protein